MTTAIASQIDAGPLGRNPPPSVSRCRPSAGWLGSPKNTMIRPMMMNAMTASTLIPERMNSTEPKDFTLKAFSPSTIAPNTTMPTHSGSSGHQNFRYVATATSSAPATSTVVAQ